MIKAIALATSAAMMVCAGSAAAQPAAQPWLDRQLPPEARAHAAVAAMTLDEKLRLVFGYSGNDPINFTDLTRSSKSS